MIGVDTAVYHGYVNCNADGKMAYHLGDVMSPYIPPGDALRNEVKQLVEGIRSGKAPVADGDAGLQVVRILEAAERSLRSGSQRVAV